MGNIKFQLNLKGVMPKLDVTPVVYRRVHVLFTILVFVCSQLVSNPYCVVFLFCFSSSCVPYVTSFSGLSILFWLLLRINGCGLFFKQQMNIKLVNMIISLIYSQKSLYYWVVTRILENTVTNRIYEGQYSPIFLKQRFYCKVEC